MALPQPMYDLEEAGIQPLTPALIKETVLTRSEATPSWVVFAYTGEHADSTAMASIIGELART